MPTLNASHLKTTIFAAMLGVASFSVTAKDLPFDTPATEAFINKLAANIKAGKVININAPALGKAYDSNEVAADAKYKGKYLWIAGVVDSVTKGFTGSITVRIRSNNQFLPIDAQLDKSVAIIEGMENASAKAITLKTVSTQEAATSLAKGQRIRLVCQGDGMIMGTPQLKACDTLSR